MVRNSTKTNSVTVHGSQVSAIIMSSLYLWYKNHNTKPHNALPKHVLPFCFLTSCGLLCELSLGVIKKQEIFPQQILASQEYCCWSDIAISDIYTCYADHEERNALLFPSAAQ